MTTKQLNIQHFDANENVFFARELENIKTKTYDIKYPDYKAHLFSGHQEQ